MNSVWRIRSAEMQSMENSECVANKECGKCGVWKIKSVWRIRGAEMRSMENEECVENREYGK